MPARARRSRCPVACTLDVLGDRWSLLVVRDVMRGKRRYAEFLESPEGHPDQHPGGSPEAARREGRDPIASATASIRRASSTC